MSLTPNPVSCSGGGTVTAIECLHVEEPSVFIEHTIVGFDERQPFYPEGTDFAAAPFETIDPTEDPFVPPHLFAGLFDPSAGGGEGSTQPPYDSSADNNPHGGTTGIASGTALVAR